MRYTTRINNVRALEWGINMTQAALFDLINECASWASTVTINGVTFYWVSRQLVIEELPLVFRKEDAVYRTLKVLEEKGLVETAKMDGRDYVRITPEGAKWNSHDAPETESRENSRDIREKNRNPRENSRNSSGKNPTDKDINNQPANQGTNQFGAPARDPAPREPSPEIPDPPPEPPPHAKPKRKQPLPDDFAVTDAMRAWFAEQGFGFALQGEHERFCDYWRGRGEPMKDWEAVWRNWMRKAADFAKPKPQAQRPSGHDLSRMDYGETRIPKDVDWLQGV